MHMGMHCQICAQRAQIQTSDWTFRVFAYKYAADNISEELLSRLTDKSILHTSGWIGGEWTLGSSKNETFQVSVEKVQSHSTVIRWV